MPRRTNGRRFNGGRAAALGVLAALLSANPALAASPEVAAQAVRDHGYWIEPGAAADEGTLGRLVAETGRRGYRFGFVALASDPSSGATAFADAVLDRMGEGTVVIVSQSQLGYSSTRFSSTALERAADASLPAFRADRTQGFVSFAQELVAPRASPTPTPGLPVVSLVPFLFMLFVVGGFFFMVWRLQRGVQRWNVEMYEGQIDEAKRELQAQVDILANGIIELSDRVSLEGSDEARRHFSAASETYAAVSEELDEVTSLQEMERLADRLDRARWKLKATRALLEGEEVPPLEREQASCFFDPTHGAGVEHVTLDTPAGSREIAVCERCATLLQRGEAPEPRRISVAGEEVPAAFAPRAYGGLGLGWFGPFSILGAFGPAVSLYWDAPVSRGPAARGGTIRRSRGGRVLGGRGGANLQVRRGRGGRRF